MLCIYLTCMKRRTTIGVDDALLSQAQEALGTKGLKETVDQAFREAIRRHLRRRLAERIETGSGVDRSPELLAETRRRDDDLLRRYQCLASVGPSPSRSSLAPVS